MVNAAPARSQQGEGTSNSGLPSVGARAEPNVVLVTMMEQREFELMGVPDFLQQVKAANIRSIHHPVRGCTGVANRVSNSMFEGGSYMCKHVRNVVYLFLKWVVGSAGGAGGLGQEETRVELIG